MSRIAWSLAGAGLLVIAGLSAPVTAKQLQVRSGSVMFSIDDETGDYAIDGAGLHFAGHLAGPPRRVVEKSGELSFDIAPNIEAHVAPARGTASALLVGWTNVGAKPVASPPAFPDFTIIPKRLYSLSHQQQDFAPPIFNEPQNVSTPWMLFDGTGRAMVISPVSDVFLASMLGDAKSRVAVGVNREVRTLPSGFTARTLIAAAPDIVGAYDAWGRAIRAYYSRKPAPADADPILRTIGILTDNAGGHYYYNYDYADGLNYEDSLVRFISRTRAAGLPFGYLQLDSWWYPKSTWNPQEQTSAVKNPKLPAQRWNRYGGLLEWRADPGVFPKGMAAFHDRVGLPFFAHNRYIDRDSPYHQRFNISGLAAIDKSYWSELANYAAHNGIAVYLQDWLSAIYNFSPELHSVPGKGLAFLDGMASAMAAHGITMQYCMGFPLYLLQGAKYPNLTTIRAAGDGLTRSRWTQIVFNARLIREVGAWPATDVMPSRDTAGMLFATLSGGPVGIGDSFEQIDRANIFKVARTDGEIVKPDAPLTPLSRSYLSQAQATGEPIIAATFTRHEAGKTVYLLAFAGEPRKSRTNFSVTPRELGFIGAVAVFDPQAQLLAKVGVADRISGQLTGDDDYAYRVVVPISRSGFAIFGDVDKFVPMGRKRVLSYEDRPDSAVLVLAAARGETSFTIAGYSDSAITAHAVGASIDSIARNAATGLFRVKLHASDISGHDIALMLARTRKPLRGSSTQKCARARCRIELSRRTSLQTEAKNFLSHQY